MEEIAKLINENKLVEALSLVEGDNEESYYYKALILFKMNKYQSSLLNVSKGLEMAKKYYYEFKKIEIEDYVALEKIKEALKILEEELGMPYIPREFHTYFNNKYDELLKELRSKENSYSPFDLLSEDELKDELIKFNSNNLVYMIHQLNKRNIRSYMDEVKILLKENINPILKSSLLEIMHNQGINEEIEVVKDGLTISVVPSSLILYYDRTSTKQILKYIDEFNEDHNISIEESSKVLLVQYLGFIYPIDIEEDETKYIALAIYLLAAKYLGYDLDLTRLINKESLNSKVLENYILEISHINDVLAS